MSKMLSNEKIINEIKASQRDYVNTRPEMIFKPYVNNRAERDYNLGDRGKRRDVIGGYKSLGQHPRYSNPVGSSAFPDPLYGGKIEYKNYSEFNNRGGAVLSEKMPLTGGYRSDSDFNSETDDENSSSESDSESNSNSESESESDSNSEYEEDIDENMEGGGIYDDYIKPVGKTLLNVGHEVFKDVVVPVGKELLKNAIVGLMSGAGMKGGKITGTKTEFIHILKKINPKIHMKELKKKTQHELARELYKILELGLHPEDLKTLHLLDAYTKANKKGGLNGTQKELEKILVAMYPQLNLEKLSKQEIIDKIKGHVDKTENKRINYNEKRRNKTKNIKSFNELPEYFEEPEEETKEEIIIDEPVKETKKRGRPSKEKQPKEPKKRGRPSKVKSEVKSESNKHLDNLENLFNEVLETPKEEVKKNIEVKITKTTKPKNRLTKAQFTRETNKDLFFKKLTPDEKKKAYDEYKKTNPLLEASFIKKYFPVNNNIGEKLFKKEGAGIKKIVGHKVGEKVRGDIVAEVMKKQGLSLGQASKYVSEHNLY